jgi:hypothetical protein
VSDNPLSSKPKVQIDLENDRALMDMPEFLKLNRTLRDKDREIERLRADLQGERRRLGVEIDETMRGRAEIERLREEVIYWKAKAARPADETAHVHQWSTGVYNTTGGLHLKCTTCGAWKPAENGDEQ